MNIDDEVYKRIQAIYADLVDIRREIHRYPEIAFNEKKTSGLVADYLGRLGIEVTAGIAKTGVVGLIKGSGNGRTIALRADMDALPVTEENDCGYKSCVTGMMHACGHDVHVACLLGVANILGGMRNELNGNVKLIFQPAEEGVGGALPMIREGVLENPSPDACAALHVWPGLPVGKVGIHYGTVFASGDRFEIIVKGKGGHGAEPHNTVDPIVTGAQIVNALQTLVSRRVETTVPVVLSICSFHAGTADNIIPDTAVLKGTVRTADKATRERIPEIMESIISGIAASSGAKYEFIFKKGYPVTVNNEKITNMMANSALRVVGNDNVITSNKPIMVSEDFSYYAEIVQGTYLILGCGNKEKGIIYPLHNPKFDADEQCIKAGAGIMAQFAIDFLEHRNS